MALELIPHRLIAHQLVAQCGQGCACAICQRYAIGDLVAYEAILRDQILIAEQQLLIDRPGHLRQQGLPVQRHLPWVFQGVMPGEDGP